MKISKLAALVATREFMRLVLCVGDSKQLYCGKCGHHLKVRPRTPHCPKCSMAWALIIPSFSYYALQATRREVSRADEDLCIEIAASLGLRYVADPALAALAPNNQLGYNASAAWTIG